VAEGEGCVTGPEDEIPKAFQAVSPELAKKIHADMLNAGFPESLSELITIYLTETGPAWASCPHCRKRVVVDLPVQKYREKIVDKLTDHFVGKPLEKRQIDHHIHTVSDLETLSDDDLHAFIAKADS
jgi:hypothetical protein